MNRNHGLERAALLLTAALLFAVAATAGFAQAALPAPVSGTIVSINGSNLTIALADNMQKKVMLRADTLILERHPATVNDIQTGEAMGVAARRSGTELIATSINIFSPEMWKAVRKGQWPMSTGETMTNAPVTDYVQGMNGHTLTMKYNDVMATITVPEDVQIHRMVSVKPAALTPGMSIVVRGIAGSDGTLTAGFVSFDVPAKG